ncbi:MAG: family 1 glycosylhydrolase [Ferruginibacter sp.]
MDIKNHISKPQIWGGIECTINRVAESFRDQLHHCGHYTRADDIAAFASIGIKALRYPVLWERHEPLKGQAIDWSWATRQLEEIRKYNITPIAGLLHHGSGPSFTSLNDPDFPNLFAAYAKKVATQFPWLEWYTPVNEPHTTARFSGLYGFWYPHYQRESDYAFMLFNQLKGTVLAMQEIRKINPAAKYVQTEDLSKTHSTPLLKYQADFENERRWLTFDILCGRINKKHFFWKHFLALGIPKAMLQFFVDNPMPPDIMGFNYYVTSERYLDENIKNYPSHKPGGNGKHIYVDVEASRVIDIDGIGKLLKEAWDRYRVTIAVTEVHLNCTRDEQMRWLYEVWESCCEMRSQGVDVKAITAWSIIGAYDWCNLLTRQEDKYESGLYDVSNNMLRKTATAKLVMALATDGKYHHPVLKNKGWWQRDIRFFKPIDRSIKIKKNNTIDNCVLIIGKNGTLGAAFTKVCNHRALDFIALSSKDLNICDSIEIERAINKYKPWALINAAGYVNVESAEMNRDECFKVNACGAELLATACNKFGIKFMTFSSDLVFDGVKFTPYIEMDGVKPLNVFGESKVLAEKMVMAINPDSLVIRSSAFFGPWDQYNFVFHVLDSLKKDQTFPVLNDVYVSPTYVPDLANTALDLFIDDEAGIWHLSSDGSCSWEGLAMEVASRAGYSGNNLVGKTLGEMELKAKRPLYSVLQSKKGIRLPALDNALERYFQEKEILEK